MKKYFKWLMKKVTYRYKQKLIEKLVGPHNKLGHSSKDYNRGKNGREKDKRKTEKDVSRLDDEIRLQQIKGESWAPCRMASLDVRAGLGSQRTTKKKSLTAPEMNMFIHKIRLNSAENPSKSKTFVFLSWLHPLILLYIAYASILTFWISTP